MQTNDFIELAAEVLETDSNELTLESELEALDWDSLANITFIAEVDDRFSAQVDADDLNEANTLADVYKLLLNSINK